MALTLTNLASHLLILQLNNGNSVYLAPGETSGAVDEGQINGNDKINKLLRNSLVAAAEAKEEPAAPKKAKAGKKA